MERREFIKTTAAGAAGLAITGGKVAASPGNKPNIIIIMADDLGYRHSPTS